MKKYFPKPESLERNTKIELDQSNYATKAGLKTTADVDTSKFTKMFYLSSLKSETYKLYIGKLETTPVYLSKLSDLIKK